MPAVVVAFVVAVAAASTASIAASTAAWILYATVDSERNVGVGGG